VEIFPDISFHLNPKCLSTAVAIRPTHAPNSGNIGDKWINMLSLNLNADMHNICGIEHDGLDQPKTLTIPMFCPKCFIPVWIHLAFERFPVKI
jgi:hypothetical protein